MKRKTRILEGSKARVEKHNVGIIPSQLVWKDESPPLDYPDSVATTWLLSLEQVSQDAQAAADMLHLCSFLAPDDIPREILSVGAEHLPEPLAAPAADRLAMNRAIKALRQYSLIGTSGESLAVHRWVQAVMRDRLREDAEKRWTETAVRFLSAAFPSESHDVQTWHLCSRLLPHALAAAAHAEAREGVPETTQHILNEITRAHAHHNVLIEHKDYREGCL